MRAAFALATLLVTTAAHAEPRPLEHTSPGALAIETGGVVAFFIGYSVAAGDPPESCHWCQINSFDRSMRSWLVRDDRRTPATLSHVFSVGIVPVGALTALAVPAIAANHPGYALADAWIVVNSFLLSTAVSDGTKKLVGRRRPAWALGDPGETELGKLEENLSFYSGDTAWAASVTASATTLAYLRGYSTAPWILGLGSLFTVTTGALRIAADAHWATDVLAGMVMGGLCGVALPLTLHRRSNRDLALAPTIMPMVGQGRWGLGLSGAF